MFLIFLIEYNACVFKADICCWSESHWCPADNIVLLYCWKGVQYTWSVIIWPLPIFVWCDLENRKWNFFSLNACSVAAVFFSVLQCGNNRRLLLPLLRSCLRKGWKGNPVVSLANNCMSVFQGYVALHSLGEYFTAKVTDWFLQCSCSLYFPWNYGIKCVLANLSASQLKKWREGKLAVLINSSSS